LDAVMGSHGLPLFERPYSLAVDAGRIRKRF
jgi:hypothetical protein